MSVWEVVCSRIMIPDLRWYSTDRPGRGENFLNNYREPRLRVGPEEVAGLGVTIESASTVVASPPSPLLYQPPPTPPPRGHELSTL